MAMARTHLANEKHKIPETSGDMATHGEKKPWTAKGDLEKNHSRRKKRKQ